MIKNQRNQTSEYYPDLVDALIRIPVKSLEKRVSELEGEIETRKSIRDSIMSELSTKALQMQDRLQLFRYLNVFDSGFRAISEIKNQVLKINDMKINETINCFRDLSKLAEKLHEVSLELVLDKTRLEIVADKYESNEKR